MRRGEAPRLYSSGSELGFYYKDTRYLQTWEMTLNGQRPVPLAHELRFQGNSAVFSMTNRDMPMIDPTSRPTASEPKSEMDSRVARGWRPHSARCAFSIRRILTLLDDILYETIELQELR